MDKISAQQMDALAVQYKALDAQAEAEYARLCEVPEAEQPAIEAALLERHAAMEAAASAVLDALLGGRAMSGRPVA